MPPRVWQLLLGKFGEGGFYEAKPFQKRNVPRSLRDAGRLAAESLSASKESWVKGYIGELPFLSQPTQKK